MPSDRTEVDLGSIRLGMATRDGASIELFDADGNLRKLNEIEADVIKLAVTLYDGCLTEVSRHLGVGRTTLYRKLERYEDLVRRDQKDHGQIRRLD